MAQSLGSAAPLAGVELKLVARNNEVLAAKTTGADGRVDFDPGLARGKGGSAPGLLVATLGRRLQFPQPDAERLRSDRPRRRRTRRAGRPRRLPLHRARRLPFGRDGVRDRAAARRQGRREERPAADARRQAAGRRRVQARDPGRRGPRRTRLRGPAAAGLGPGQMDDRGLRRPEGRLHRRGPVPARGLYSRAARFHPPGRKALHRSGRAGRVLARRALPLRRAGERARRHRRDPPARRSRAARSPAIPALSPASPTTISPPSRASSPTRCRPTPRATPIFRIDLPEATATRPLEAKLIVDVAEPGGRTVERTLTLPVRAKTAHGRGEEGLRRFAQRRRYRDVRGDRRRPRRHPRRPQGRRVVALPGDQRLSMVQRRRPLELRAGQVVEAGGERNDRHRRRRAGQVLGARSAGARIGSTSRRSTARRRASPSTSAGRARRAPTRPTTSSSRSTRRTTRRATRRSCASSPRYRRQGDGGADRRRDRALRRRRSRRRRQRRAVRGRRRLGPGRLCGRADPSAARRRGEAHARPRDRRSPGSPSPASAQARRHARRAVDGEAARAAVRADHGRRPRAGRGGAGDRLGGRHRHSQPDRLQDAGPGRVFLRPAQAARSRSATSGAC